MCKSALRNLNIEKLGAGFSISFLREIRGAAGTPSRPAGEWETPPYAKPEGGVAAGKKSHRDFAGDDRQTPSVSCRDGGHGDKRVSARTPNSASRAGGAVCLRFLMPDFPKAEPSQNS